MKTTTLHRCTDANENEQGNDIHSQCLKKWAYELLLPFSFVCNSFTSIKNQINDSEESVAWIASKCGFAGDRCYSPTQPTRILANGKIKYLKRLKANNNEEESKNSPE